MKTLYILRHAKASSNMEDYADIDRPLKPSGIADAYALGEALKKRKAEISAIAVSDACRALQTATIVAREAHIAGYAIAIHPELYLPDDDSVTMDIIRATPDSVSSLMVVGHNPNLSMLCGELLPSFAEELPTCGLVAIEVSASRWLDVNPDNAKYLYNIFPK